jgi:L-iditol 2-dehydrogenase
LDWAKFCCQINLKFINRYADTWPAGIKVLSGGILNLDKLVTHAFPLEDAIEAMELCGDVRKGSVKVQIVDQKEINP